MKKQRRISLAITAMLLACPLFGHAQIDVEIDEDTTTVADNKTDDNTTVTTDNDFDMPEAMTDEVDSLLHLYNIQQYLQDDEECDYPDVNPTYEPEVYKERLAKLPTIIEMPYNDVVQQCIDRYTGKLRRSVRIMLGASNFYMPIFEEALEAYGLPLELKYLPIIESGLNPKAVSRVGATGLWQFMITTGKQYGLEVNTLVDDRRDPIKASNAAAHYLSDLYKIFGDWNLVIAAYNCGPTNIQKAIHRAGGQKDYWAIYPYLPRETRGYVPAFIAANYVMNYYCEHNICPMTSELPAKTDTIMVDRNIHFDQISQVLNIDVKEIEALNPQYRQDIVCGQTRPSVLKLKAQDIIAFIDNQDSIYACTSAQVAQKRTEVAVTETTTTTKKSSKKKKKSSGGGSKNQTIREGDTLSAIAKRNGTTVAKLRKLNPQIKGDAIRAGKKIRVK